MSIWTPLKRQLLIFMGYFLFCSLFLFNHSGGADILFTFLLFMSVGLHIIVALVKVVRGRGWTIADLVILLVILMLLVLLFGQYLEFMWWFTSAIKGRS